MTRATAAAASVVGHREATPGDEGRPHLREVAGPQLLEELSNAARTCQLAHALHDHMHPHVLVVDEIGYPSLKDNAANVLFQVVNERYLQRKPILFTTNKPLAVGGTRSP